MIKNKIEWKTKHFKTKHIQTLVDGVLVDYGLAKTLKALWDSGIKTQYSCQGSNISDQTGRYSDSCYIIFEDHPFIKFLVKYIWEKYNVSNLNIPAEVELDCWCGVIRYCFRFPMYHYLKVEDIILNCLEEYKKI